MPLLCTWLQANKRSDVLKFSKEGERLRGNQPSITVEDSEAGPETANLEPDPVKPLTLLLLPVPSRDCTKNDKTLANDK